MYQVWYCLLPFSSPWSLHFASYWCKRLSLPVDTNQSFLASLPISPANWLSSSWSGTTYKLNKYLLNNCTNEMQSEPRCENIYIYIYIYTHTKYVVLEASLVAQLVKNPSATRETRVRSLRWEDPLEKGKATHSSMLAWRIKWTVQSMGSQRDGHDWTTFTFFPFTWYWGVESQFRRGEGHCKLTSGTVGFNVVQM